MNTVEQMTPRQQHISDLNALTIKYGSIFLSIIKKDYIRTAKAIIEAKDVNVQIVVDERRYAYNLYKLYLTIGIDKTLEEHNKLARSLKASNDLMIYDWLTFLKGYADKTLAERVTKIPDTTRAELRELIQKGMEDGKGYEDIAKTIQKEGDGDFSKYRSLLIARTEGNNAVNAGAYIAARSSGLQMVKRWLHAGHAKRENRPEHVRLSKLEPIGLNDYFNVNGKQMLFPGDPSGGAGENCNCRCIGSYRPQRGADGLVIAVNRRAYEVTGIQRAERTALVDRILAEYEDVVVARNVTTAPMAVTIPVKPVFRPAATIKEAEERIMEAGVKEASLKGLKQDQANAVLKAIENENAVSPLNIEKVVTYRKASDTSAALYSASNRSINLNLSKIGENVVREVIPYPQQLQEAQAKLMEYQSLQNNPKIDQSKLYSRINSLNNRIYDLGQKIQNGEQARPFTISSTFRSEAENIFATITHEIGHYRHLTQLNDKVYFHFNKATSVTEYGRVNEKEYFAEWYAYYRVHGENGVPEALLKILKEL